MKDNWSVFLLQHQACRSSLLFPIYWTKEAEEDEKEKEEEKKKHSENQMINEHIRFIMNDMITNDFFKAITSQLHLKHSDDIFKQNKL